MARFDLHPSGDGYLLDCQADILSHLNTRLVVPVRPPDQAPLAGHRLNPRFEIEGQPFVMVTQFASAVPVKMLKRSTASLAAEHDVIMSALDVLLTGV